jgi:hypothetical protein
MKSLRTLAVGAALAAGALAMALPAAASTFVLSNSNGGDGYVTDVSGVGVPTTMDLFSANNGAPNNYTLYSGVAPSTGTWVIDYTYTTNNCCGSFWDPAGIVIGGVTDQLSPASSAPGASNSGVLTFSATKGEAIDFYVYTYDGAFGRADLFANVLAVPEPATWALMILGVGGLGAMARRRRGQAAALSAA